MPLALYDRAAAVAYARKWALSRNPAYYDYDPLGGDCTNFASQCVLAGGGVMNLSPRSGGTTMVRTTTRLLGRAWSTFITF
jgi:hypothetical protein